MSDKLGPNTMVPLSILGVLTAGIFALSMMFGDISRANQEIGEIKKEMKLLYLIDRRLSKIEGKLDLLLRQGE